MLLLTSPIKRVGSQKTESKQAIVHSIDRDVQYIFLYYINTTQYGPQTHTPLIKYGRGNKSTEDTEMTWHLYATTFFIYCFDNLLRSLCARENEEVEAAEAHIIILWCVDVWVCVYNAVVAGCWSMLNISHQRLLLFLLGINEHFYCSTMIFKAMKRKQRTNFDGEYLRVRVSLACRPLMAKSLNNLQIIHNIRHWAQNGTNILMDTFIFLFTKWNKYFPS